MDKNEIIVLILFIKKGLYMDRKIKGYLYVAIAGILWSTIGLFGNNLMSVGLTPEQVSFARLLLGCLILVMYSLIKNPNLLKISKKGILYSIALGFICQALYNYCYFNAIEKVGVSTSAVLLYTVSTSAVLLYTSPLFLAILSKIIYQEKLTKNKIVSLAICFIGAILVVTGGKFDFVGLDTLGVMMGIISAIAYSLMPIINKNALKENESITLTMYGFLFGAIFMLPLANIGEFGTYIGNTTVLINLILLALLPAAMAYIFYVDGISQGIELSIAGVVASTELVFASIIGWIVLGEEFSLIKLFGLILMIISTVVAFKRSNKQEFKDLEKDIA